MASLNDGVTVRKTRNIIVVGKTGCGKSSVANRILGVDAFKVVSSPSSATSAPSMATSETYDDGICYIFNVIDTIGLFDTRKISNKEIMQKTKEAVKGLVDGLHLIVFVMREGRVTEEEKETFRLVHTHFAKDIDPLSLLVITGCEGSDYDEVKREITGDKITKNIVSHMHKGVVPVGFIDIKKVRPSFKDAYSEQEMEDKAKLRKIVYDSDTKYLTKQLYDKKWCTIL